MKKKRIARRWYKIPQTIKDVTLEQFIVFYKINNKRVETLGKIDESTDVKEQHLLHCILGDVTDRMIAAISDIPYTLISTLEAEKKAKVYTWFNPIFDTIQYKANSQSKFKRFRFQKHEYFLFEFGVMTGKQMLWLETYWKQFYQMLSGEIANMNFDELPRIIAISAFKKNEINLLINDERELPSEAYGSPYEIKLQYYEKFAQLVERRVQLFKKLPLSVVYGCLDFFFANSRTILHSIQTSIPTTPIVPVEKVMTT